MQRSCSVRRARSLVVSSAAASPAFAQSPAEFFKDKTVTFYVGLSAGGGYDVNARLVAKHIGKYIPGNPQVIVRNMPGGGGLVMTNYVANVATKDGLHIGAPQRGIPFEPLLRRSLEREIRCGEAQLDRQRQYRHQRGGRAQAHRRQDLAGSEDARQGRDRRRHRHRHRERRRCPTSCATCSASSTASSPAIRAAAR